MYSGPGPGPMLAAASAWDALAAELHTVALTYDSVIAELNTGWSGPSAAAMAAAAAPYAKWMHTTAAQAEHAATQARTAATAYEIAFAMTVPPPVIATNRAQLMTLQATNFLGQNTAAIAATEAHYAEMWAQDATAMYSYAGNAAAASQLTPFTQPPQTTNPAASTNQAAAVGQAVGTAAGSQAVTQTLQGLTAPATTAQAGAATLAGAAAPASATGVAVFDLALSFFEVGLDMTGALGIDSIGAFVIDSLGAAVSSIGTNMLLPFVGLASSVTPAAAGIGGAASISGLSVPPAWTVAAKSAASQVGTPLPAAGAAAAPAVAAGEPAIPLGGMATAALAGRATAAVGRGGGDRAGTTSRRHRSGPPKRSPQRPELPELPGQSVYGLIVGMDLELRELAELRAAGVLTGEEYTQAKRRLLGR